MQQLREFGTNFINNISNKNKLPPDDLMVSCKKQLKTLKQEIMLVKTQFTQYSHQVVESSEASVTLSKSVRDFYSKANHPGRTESVNMYAKVQEDIANRAVNTFHITVENGLISELGEWIELISSLSLKIDNAESTRMTAHDTQNRLASLQSEYQEKKQKKQGLFGGNREHDLEDLQNRINEAMNLQKSLFAEYQKSRNSIAQNVKQMMTSRYVQFDRIYVQMLECQAEFFQHTANISKRFQRDIDYYRKQYPKSELSSNASSSSSDNNQNQTQNTNKLTQIKEANGHQSNGKIISTDTSTSSSSGATSNTQSTKSSQSQSQSPSPPNNKKPKIPNEPPPSYKQYKENKNNKTTSTSASASPPNVSNGYLNGPTKTDKPVKRQESTHRDFLNFGDIPTSPPKASKTSSSISNSGVNKTTNHDENDPFGDFMFATNNEQTNNDDFGIHDLGQPTHDDLLGFGGPTNLSPKEQRRGKFPHSTSDIPSRSTHSNAAHHDDFFGDMFGATNASSSSKLKAQSASVHSPHQQQNSVSDFFNESTSSPNKPKPKQMQKKQSLENDMNNAFNSVSYNVPSSPNPVQSSTTNQVSNGGANIESQVGKKQMSEAEKQRAQQAYEEEMKRRENEELNEKKEIEETAYWKEKHEAMLTNWEYENHVRRNVRTLIGKLPDIIPAHLNWKPIPMTKLLNDAQLKKGYYKAVRLVHPDKSIGRGDDMEARVICAAVFQALDQAFKKQFD